jgi:hypothetical protein
LSSVALCVVVWFVVEMHETIVDRFLFGSDFKFCSMGTIKIVWPRGLSDVLCVYIDTPLSVIPLAQQSGAEV